MPAGIRTLRSIADLAAAGLLEEAAAPALGAVAERYAVAVTPAIVALIDPGDADDPIARQFIPDARELEQTSDERADPIGDGVHEKLPGLIHRYPDRVLLKLTHACPVYCRFCFRREVVGPSGDGMLSGANLDRAIGYIRDNPAIWEVILTGGDPLMLSSRRIADVTERLADIPHVQVLRWHSRVPVVDPERLTEALADALTKAAAAKGKAVYVGVHANHPRELTDAARDACRRLTRAGVTLVSQTVLLKGINDDLATLDTLFRAFVRLGIRPYYLHHADFAPGTSRFRTSIAEGQALMRQLRGRVSGLALPTYVLDVPGGHGKVPVGPDHADTAKGEVVDIHGQVHRYPPEGK